MDPSQLLEDESLKKGFEAIAEYLLDHHLLPDEPTHSVLHEFFLKELALFLEDRRGTTLKRGGVWREEPHETIFYKTARYNDTRNPFWLHFLCHFLQRERGYSFTYLGRNCKLGAVRKLRGEDVSGTELVFVKEEVGKFSITSETKSKGIITDGDSIIVGSVLLTSEKIPLPSAQYTYQLAWPVTEVGTTTGVVGNDTMVNGELHATVKALIQGFIKYIEYAGLYDKIHLSVHLINSLCNLIICIIHKLQRVQYEAKGAGLNLKGTGLLKYCELEDTDTRNINTFLEQVRITQIDGIDDGKKIVGYIFHVISVLLHEICSWAPEFTAEEFVFSGTELQNRVLQSMERQAQVRKESEESEIAAYTFGKLIIAEDFVVSLLDNDMRGFYRVNQIVGMKVTQENFKSRRDKYAKSNNVLRKKILYDSLYEVYNHKALCNSDNGEFPKNEETRGRTKPDIMDQKVEKTRNKKTGKESTKYQFSPERFAVPDVKYVYDNDNKVYGELQDKSKQIWEDIQTTIRMERPGGNLNTGPHAIIQAFSDVLDLERHAATNAVLRAFQSTTETMRFLENTLDAIKNLIPLERTEEWDISETGKKYLSILKIFEKTNNPGKFYLSILKMFEDGYLFTHTSLLSRGICMTCGTEGIDVAQRNLLMFDITPKNLEFHGIETNGEQVIISKEKFPEVLRFRVHSENKQKVCRTCKGELVKTHSVISSPEFLFIKLPKFSKCTTPLEFSFTNDSGAGITYRKVAQIASAYATTWIRGSREIRTWNDSLEEAEFLGVDSFDTSNVRYLMYARDKKPEENPIQGMVIADMEKPDTISVDQYNLYGMSTSEKSHNTSILLQALIKCSTFLAMFKTRPTLANTIAYKALHNFAFAYGKKEKEKEKEEEKEKGRAHLGNIMKLVLFGKKDEPCSMIEILKNLRSAIRVPFGAFSFKVTDTVQCRNCRVTETKRTKKDDIIYINPKILESLGSSENKNKKFVELITRESRDLEYRMMTCCNSPEINSWETIMTKLPQNFIIGFKGKMKRQYVPDTFSINGVTYTKVAEIHKHCLTGEYSVEVLHEKKKYTIKGETVQEKREFVFRRNTELVFYSSHYFDGDQTVVQYNKENSMDFKVILEEIARNKRIDFGKRKENYMAKVEERKRAQEVLIESRKKNKSQGDDDNGGDDNGGDEEGEGEGGEDEDDEDEEGEDEG